MLSTGHWFDGISEPEAFKTAFLVEALAKLKFRKNSIERWRVGAGTKEPLNKSEESALPKCKTWESLSATMLGAPRRTSELRFCQATVKIAFSLGYRYSNRRKMY